MNKVICLVMIMLVCLCGCSGRKAIEERVAQAEDLLLSDPSVAERMLYEISLSGSMPPSQQADVTRGLALARLKQGKTYVMETGLDQAIDFYKSQADTAALQTALQLAFIRERWLGEQDSAASYLHEAIEYAPDSALAYKGELYIELSNLYALPRLPKDYAKAIGYAGKALLSDRYKGRALHDIGLFYAFSGESDSALRYMEEALEVTSPDHQDYTTFALNYAGNKDADPDKCMKYLNEIDVNHLGKIITLGFIFLNQGKINEAAECLEKASAMYDVSPEDYSVNTYNQLRLLKGCVDYARNGKVESGEGTMVNDSIGERLTLIQKIEAEKTEYDNRLQMKLLKSESQRQKVWIVCLVVMIVMIMISGWLVWRRRQSYIRIQRELEEMRMKQIVCETDAPESSSSFLFIAERARICTDRFRKTGGTDIIQRGETLYAEGKSFLPLKERTTVRNLLLECFADFIVDLRIDAGKMTMEDIMTCLLSLMRMNNAAIASCIGCSDGAVRTRKTRLKGKMSDEMVELVFA